MSTPRPVTEETLHLIYSLEGCKLVAYPDGGGVPTIATGHTGPEVHLGMTCTVAEALAWRLSDANIAAGKLAKVVNDSILRGLDEHQYGALITFVFNLGAKPDWTIWKVLNKGQLDLVPDQMKRFDKMEDPKTHQLVDCPGLDNRRKAEITYWNTADVHNAIGVMQMATVQPPPSSVTREANTPPTPVFVPPLTQSKSFISGTATAVAGVAATSVPLIQAATGGVKQVSDAITPYAASNPLLSHMQEGLMMTMAGLAVATVVLLWLKHKDAKAA